MIATPLFIFISFLIVVLILFLVRFYPSQLLPVSKAINIVTPEFEKYKNDCLHPCVRYIPEGFAGYKWWMVQSPYYARNNKIENVLLYRSNEINFPENWEFVCIVKDTPELGYNSDPVLFYESNKLFVFWRECSTPLCNQLNVSKITVGVSTVDSINFSSEKVYLNETQINSDTEQCPILVKKNDKYIFYAIHYEYFPQRKNIGLALWEGTSLDEPDFKYKETIPLKSVLTCDKWKQLKLFNRLLFIPKPLKHNYWHFDLFEYNSKLYMVSVDEWGDNIMLSVSENYRDFKAVKTPLINSHYSENIFGYRQYYYKPTALVVNNTLGVYYTATHKNDRFKNQLYYSLTNQLQQIL